MRRSYQVHKRDRVLPLSTKRSNTRTRTRKKTRLTLMLVCELLLLSLASLVLAQLNSAQYALYLDILLGALHSVCCCCVFDKRCARSRQWVNGRRTEHRQLLVHGGCAERRLLLRRRRKFDGPWSAQHPELFRLRSGACGPRFQVDFLTFSCVFFFVCFSSRPCSQRS